MCGISGIWSSSPSDMVLASVNRMVAASHHRGPDARATYRIPLLDSQLVFGHTRLSILDLSADSNQPMIDLETGSCLVYNGEIYNYAVIREELEAGGTTFATRGDTEVLLKALGVWGIEGLNRLRGMFAFGYWDAVGRRVILARDPLGIKPLYYTERGGEFVFASEVKILRVASKSTSDINMEAVHTYLTYGAVIGPATILNEVFELPPGGVLVKKQNERAELRRYWSMAEALPTKSEHRRNNRDASHHIAHVLEAATRRHLISDVPIGLALSGGLDSTLLAVLAAQAKINLRLITIAFPEQQYSEERTASATAHEIGAPHSIIHISADDLANRVSRAVKSLDQPTIDGINSYLVAEAAASEGVKVLLSGLGGDEVFGGYSTFWKVSFWHDNLNVLRRVAPLARIAHLPNASQFRKIEQCSGRERFEELYLLQRSIRWKHSEGGLPPNLVPPEAFHLPPEAWANLSRTQKGSPYHRVSALELQFYMANQLLRDADVYSMASSIEMRVPFLDLDVLSEVWRYPGHRHSPLIEGKRLERSILNRISQRQWPRKAKRGFTMPWNEWLRRGRLRKEVEEVTRDRGSQLRMSLNTDQCGRTLDEFFSGGRLASWEQVWSLYLLFRWIARNDG